MTLPKRIDLLSPPVMLAATVGLSVVAPLFYSLMRPLDRKALLLPLTPDSIMAALALTGLWVIAWAIGYLFTRARLPLVGAVAVPGPFALRNLVLWTGAIVVLSIALYFLVVTHPAFGNTTTRAGLTAGIHGKAIFVASGIASVLLIGLSAAAAIAWRRASNRDRVASAVLLAVATVICIWALWKMGGRGRALQPLIGMVVVFHYYVRPLRLWMALVLGTLGLVAVTLMGRGNLPGMIALLFDGRQNFEGFYSLNYIYHFFGGNIVSWGRPAVNAIAGDIGLNLGPTATDLIMSNLFPGYVRSWSISLTKSGEMLIDFGWVGIPIFGAICGVLSWLAYRYLALGRALGIMSIPVYLYLVWSVGLATFHGDLFESLLVRSFPAVAGAVVWLLILRRRA